MTDIAKNICEFRKKCGLTQRELSEKVGVSIQTVSKWEKGISLPDVNLLPVIASVFEVSIDRLFGCDSETALKDIDDSYKEIADLIVSRIKFTQSKAWYSESVEERRTQIDEIRKLLEENPSWEAGYGLPYTKIMYYSKDTGFVGIDDVGKTMFPDEVDELFEFLSKKINRRIVDKLLTNGRRRHISVEFIAEELRAEREEVQKCMNFLMTHRIMGEAEVPLEEGKTVKIYKWVEPAIGSRQYIMLRAIAAFARKFAHQPEKYVIFIG